MRIGNLSLDSRFFLAPLCGYTDRAFRRVARECGCRVVFTEMISAVGIVRSPKIQARLIDFSADEAPIGVQMNAPDPDTAARAAEILVERGATLLNVNVGCPARKIIKGGSGSALLRNLPLLREVLTAVRARCRVPLTVKTRSGWDDSHLTYMEVGRICEETGVDAIFLHPRTRAQVFAGLSDWTHIARLKEATRIPVVGNGDVHTPEDAARMMEQTGCDGVMVGRAAVGNPWIFRGLEAMARGEPGEWRPTSEERRDAMLAHLGYLADARGAGAALDMRKHLVAYTRGLPDAAAMRRRLQSLKTIDDVVSLISTFFDNLPVGGAPRAPELSELHA